MRFMMFVKGDAAIEAGFLPDKQLFIDMGKYNDALMKAGMLMYAEGLRESSVGARVSFTNGETSVVDGPFANPTELVSGFWMIKAESKEDVIAWAKRIPFKDGVVEIRQVAETEDFPAEIQTLVREEPLH